MVPTPTTKTVKLKLKKATPSVEQRKQTRNDAQQAAEALQADVDVALDDLHTIVENLALRHNRSEDFIAEQLHLGGHVIKQKRAPGLNNAYAHCEARSANEWLHDESKVMIRAIIEEAKELGGYEHLKPEQKQALVNALEESRAVDDTGIVRRPLAQLHDTRIVLERVCRELQNLHYRCGIEIILYGVRGNPAHHSAPVLLMTPKAETFIGTVLGLKGSLVLTQFEAFALNGLTGVLRSHEERRNFMKSYISKTIKEQIQLLANDSTLRMEFRHYEKKIVEEKGIVITGWTYHKFVSPSDFKKLADIKELYDAIRAGTCKATQLSSEDWQARIVSNKLRAAHGEPVYAPEPPASKKRKTSACDAREEEEEEEEEEEVADEVAEVE
ncbi:hypothetical protein PILCRDRAFT_504494 [Piloderma croceum F 1598]|uniref:Uncharacterized protein n=1 Tax=Piloderma croceum (strain F 1598) TaxID=765440 RepID=A0A0C3FNA1_PILCF|nr:hypothetical protein PILCRDRAFT_504494 [Piloderma croceum F 1598]